MEARPMGQLNFTNWSMRKPGVGESNWYDWCLFLDASTSELEAIQSVEYTLHPSFQNPIRRNRDRRTKFALFSEGWGTFEVKIRVAMNADGTLEQRYGLLLDIDNWPRPINLQPSTPDEARALEVLTESPRFRWRKISTIVRRLGVDQANTENILQQLYSSGLARMATFHSIDGADLWGATQRVGWSPEQAVPIV
jgi:hypothetical protein